MQFCSEQKVDPLHPSTQIYLNFLAQYYKTGVGYSAMNTARSAISSFISVLSGTQIGNNPIVKRFMAGVFNDKPALPRYNVTWDVSIVLDYLRKQSPVRKLSLLALSKKLAMLFLLLSGHRGQSLVLIDTRNIRCSTSAIKLTFGDLLKHSRPGTHAAELTLPAYAPDRRLCIVTVYKEYILRTEKLRNSQEHALFLSSIKPHLAASRDTISKWIKSVLKSAGIDINIFTPHSVRAASTSSAKVPLATIMRTACWTSAGTFQKYYKKPIVAKTLGGGSVGAVRSHTSWG